MRRWRSAPDRWRGTGTGSPARRSTTSIGSTQNSTLDLAQAPSSAGLARIPAAVRRAAPAARLAGSAELLLLHDVDRRNGWSSRPRLPFGVGQDVDLAVRLLERLRHPGTRQPLPPGEARDWRPTAWGARAGPDVAAGEIEAGAARIARISSPSGKPATQRSPSVSDQISRRAMRLRPGGASR